MQKLLLILFLRFKCIWTRTLSRYEHNPNVILLMPCVQIMSTLDTWFSLSTNPLVLLVAGAGISGLLIPYFTRRWQDRQEELRIKVKLILDFSKAVTETITAMESIEDKSGVKKLFNQNCQDVWSEKIPEIGAQIHTYFHNSRKKIPQFWENYKKLVNRFCNLSSMEDTVKREYILLEINLIITHLEREGENIHKITDEEIHKVHEKPELLPEKLKILAKRTNDGYTDQWMDLRGRVFDLKHELMKRIIESSMIGFSRGLIGFLRRR